MSRYSTILYVNKLYLNKTRVEKDTLVPSAGDILHHSQINIDILLINSGLNEITLKATG